MPVDWRVCCMIMHDRVEANFLSENVVAILFILRTFARQFSNIDFFLRLLPLKVNELVMSEM